MFEKLVKSSLASIVALSLGFSFVHHKTFAEEKIDGKCSITIDASKHTGDDEKSFAKATGMCGKRVTGYYAGGHFTVSGGYDGDVVDGEKYNVTIMPGFYTYEVTVHTVSQAQTLKAPTVHSINTADKKIIGVTEPNLIVSVKSGSTTLGSAKSNKNGEYSVLLKKTQKAGSKLNVTVTKGKESKTKTIIVKYTAPNVNAVKTTTTSVKGTTEPWAKVSVKVGSKTLGLDTANKKGAYSVKIKKQKAGVKLTISATKSKNSSETRTVTVKK